MEEEKWSPELISKRLPIELEFCVSHETIYQWIWIAKHSNHRDHKALNVKTYFKRPYTSQDKGTVENRIGVIRRFFPKKTDLRFISKTRIKEVESLLNY